MSSNTTFKHPDEILSQVNLPLGASGWIEINQERIDRFAVATEDRQWIHVDHTRAERGPYGKTVAHGYLMLSLIPRLGAEVMRIENSKMTLNYGLNRVRFTDVVPEGSMVRARVQLLRAEVKAGGVLATLETVMERKGGSRPVLVAEHLKLVLA